MARLRYSARRTTNTISGHVGKILLFCEGVTEENYFNYFKEVFAHKEFKYSNIVIETVPIRGNARAVLNRANEFFSDEQNTAIYRDYRKFLVFDCDAPDDIQSVISDALNSPNDYHLLLTNLLFETWLRMHFVEVEEPLKKAATFKQMADYYRIDYYGDAEKADSGLIRNLIGDGLPVRKAIENAMRLEAKWKEAGKEILRNIDEMNPYTQVHYLVSEIMDELDSV